MHGSSVGLPVTFKLFGVNSARRTEGRPPTLWGSWPGSVAPQRAAGAWTRRPCAPGLCGVDGRFHIPRSKLLSCSLLPEAPDDQFVASLGARLSGGGAAGNDFPGNGLSPSGAACFCFGGSCCRQLPLKPEFDRCPL